jgi:acyl-CoA thioesterase FadM
MPGRVFGTHTIAVAGKVAVTRRTASEFIRPVRVGLVHEVEAVIDDIDDTITTSAFIRDHRERLCVTARATFVPLGPAQLRDATGAEPQGPIVEMLAWDR